MSTFRKYLSIEIAASAPVPIALTTDGTPGIISPPANTPGILVSKVIVSIFNVLPPGFVSISSKPVKSDFCPIAKITVSPLITGEESSLNSGLNEPSSS